MKPLLSIVVPVYNAGNFLHECIESVINQSYIDFELLLVDDGSIDDSLLICRQYASEDSRIKVISREHVGPYEARKYGVLQSRGDYVTFLDADDFVSKDSYVLALDDMRASVDIIMFDILRYYNEEDVRYDACLLDNKVYNRNEIESEIYPVMIWDDSHNRWGIDPTLCDKLYKSNLLKEYYKISHKVSFHYGEDIAVVYPVIKSASSISIHHEAYYFHRQREKGELPSYIKDNRYLDKLYELYSYLIADLGRQELFRRQIDLFYMYSVELVGRKYGIPQNEPNVIFPFDKVNKGERIILYGAGNIGRLYMKQLRLCSFCDIILWVDKNYESLEKDIFSPREIKNVDYEKIVIAIAEPTIVNKVTEYLVDMGVDKDKIVF